MQSAKGILVVVVCPFSSRVYRRPKKCYNAGELDGRPPAKEGILLSKDQTHFDSTMIPLWTYDSSKYDLNGRTDVYPTGIDYLDEYLNGGIGKAEDFEIVVVFGEVKQGKSAFAMNLLAGPIKQGKTVGMFMFEERYEAIKAKMEKIVGPEIINHNNRIFTHNAEQEYMWTLDDLSRAIDKWFDKCDVILVDHLQAVFEEASILRGDNQWNVQKVFLNRIRRIMAREKNKGKAIILVSHVSKGQGQYGSNRIQGTHGIKEYCTKSLEVFRDEMGKTYLKQWESRYTYPSEKEPIEIYWDFPKIVTPDKAVTEGVKIG